jgi:hypothetical protein
MEADALVLFVAQVRGHPNQGKRPSSPKDDGHHTPKAPSVSSHPAFYGGLICAFAAA